MPYKHEKLLIDRNDDRRVKLTLEDRESIRTEYEFGDTSQRKLAKKYNVSRRLIQFILDPSKLERALEKRRETGGSMQYYDREKHTKQVREYRRYKEKLKKMGKLIKKGGE